MEIRVLRYFLAVVNEESITKAAKILHITQPTLSRQLSQLEEEVGVELFKRGSRRITLTEEGMLLRRRAEEILSLVDKTHHELLESEAQIEGQITIGSGETEAIRLLPEIIKTFIEKYPNVTFDIFTGAADLVKEQMDRGLIDVGVLLEPVDIEKFEFIRLPIRENWVTIMRPDCQLAQKEFVTPKDLSEVPLILPRRLSVRNELANWFGDYYKKLNVKFVSNLNTNAAIMVNAGLAYSVVINGGIPFWDNSKIVARPLNPQLTATSVIAWKRSQPFSPAVTKFIEHVKYFLSISDTYNIGI